MELNYRKVDPKVFVAWRTYKIHKNADVSVTDFVAGYNAGLAALKAEEKE